MPLLRWPNFSFDRSARGGFLKGWGSRSFCGIKARPVNFQVRRRNAILENQFLSRRNRMGTAKKGRRKLTISGRLFIWYVAQDDDSADLVLHVASDDKSFIVNYHL